MVRHDSPHDGPRDISRDDPHDIGVRMIPPVDPHVVVLFGATGDLAKRKLLPGLYHLARADLLCDYRVLGADLGAMSSEGFRKVAAEAIKEFGRQIVDEDSLSEFLTHLEYVSIADGTDLLAERTKALGVELGPEHRILHYLSVPPNAALDVVELISQAELVDRSRIVMEKPFGTNLRTARHLNDALHQTFDESQIFRIDHFLGKEAALNILAFRFANGLFEPIWNRQHIDHVQIDVPETLGLGQRTSFYEATGAFRDMVVTHLFQVLAFMAMEPPTDFTPLSISEEKQKVFRSMQPIQASDVVRGQYQGYLDEPGVDPHSDTETFIALRCEIDNWRWAGVPFYLRTGKRMGDGSRIISIAFREPPRSMFPPGSGVGAHGPDHLTFDLADASKLSLSFYGKRPGPGMRLDKQSLQFALHSDADVLEAYERLIHDAMGGDHTLFTTSDGIERLWEVSEPLLADPPPVRPYAPASWGPNAVHQLIAPNAWRLPFERAWRED
jgi:glucose-6-phosphate 1-dehydrogenase